MNIDAYEYSSGGRNGGFEGIDVEMALNTTDEFVISIISEYLHAKTSIDLESNIAKFFFIIEERCHDCPYQNYRKPVNNTVKDRVKKELTERIIADCINKVDRESAIIYHSLLHN